MQVVLKQNFIPSITTNHKVDSFGKKIGILASLFGCWHPKLSRPVTFEKVSYRACLHCGARQKFDAERLQTTKRFYYPPTISQLSNMR